MSTQTMEYLLRFLEVMAALFVLVIAGGLVERGMVPTVEAGLYIAEAKDIPAGFRNIGIRIEDDVLVTREGNEVLSRDAPKGVDEIEALMKH